MLIHWRFSKDVLSSWAKYCWKDDIVQVAKNEMMASEVCFTCLTWLYNLYSANSMWHVQMRFTISIHEIEPKALKAPLAAAIRFMYEYVLKRTGHEFYKVPRIGLLKVERLGQRLNVPTQGRRVAQTRDERPFSLTAPGSDPQPRIEPRPHWWEANVLTTRPPEHRDTSKASQNLTFDLKQSLCLGCHEDQRLCRTNDIRFISKLWYAWVSRCSFWSRGRFKWRCRW